MRRIFLFAIAGFVLAAVALGSHALLAACRPLDRLWGGTACPERSINIAGFRLIDGQVMSPIDKEGVASLFGWVAGDSEAGSSPGRVRVNLSSGREIDRQPLDYLNGNRWHMAFARDGERAAITCFGTQPCSHDGWRRALISVHDGSYMHALEPPAAYLDPLSFPDDPKPGSTYTEAARFAADGERIVFIDSNGGVSLQNADGEQVAVLFDEPRPRRGLAFLNALSISPSGSYVALLDASQDAPALLVWETGAGTLLARLDLPPHAYEIDIDPAWTADEDRLAIVRYRHHRDPALRETALDIFGWR